MKRLNTDLFWSLISDFFSNNIQGNDRRLYDALWQSFASSSADLVRYTDFYKKSKSVYSITPYAPYGNYPDKPYLVDITSNSEATILGYRDGYWVVFSQSESIPKYGFIRVESNSYPYGPSFSVATESGYFHFLKSESSTFSWGLKDNPSFAFGTGYGERWNVSGGSRVPSVTTNGLLMNNEWVNWFVVADKFHMNGGTSWSQKWLMRVIDWDPTNSLRSISINVFGDSGPAYEARLSDRGGFAQGQFGLFALTKEHTINFSGSTATRSRGSWIGDGFTAGMDVEITGTASNNGTKTIASVTSTTLTFTSAVITETTTTPRILNSLVVGSGDSSSWRAMLNNATPSSPVIIEIGVDYSASTGNITSSITVGGDTVTQTTPYKTHPGRKKVVLDFFNQYRNAKVILDSMYSTGSIWESIGSYDFSSDIGSEYNFIYQCEAPLINASKLCVAPWDLTVDAEATVSSETMVLEVDEEFNSYYPDYAKVVDEDGNYASISKIDVNTYEILSSSTQKPSGAVKVTPWSTLSFRFIEQGLFATKEPLPIEDGEELWFRNAEGVELDIYNRYGKLLGMRRGQDSKEYLDAVRGTDYGLKSPATPYHMANAINAIVGVPYSIDSGRIASITREYDELGAPINDVVRIDNKNIRVSPYWKDNGLLKKEGQYVNFMESLANTVQVIDYKSNYDEIAKRVSPWQIWSTFLISVPSTVGLNSTKAGDIENYVKRGKSIHNDFIIDFSDYQSEFIGRDSDVIRWGQQNIAHGIEDMVFDDYGEVVGQDLQFQTIGGPGGLDVSEEWQFDPTDLTLDSGTFLDYTENAINNALSKPNPIKLGHDTYDYGDEYIYMKSGVVPYLSFRNSFRTPYSLIWAYDGETENLASYSTAEWYETTYSGASGIELFAATEDKLNPRISYIGGESDLIYRSINYGKSWTPETVLSGTGGDFISISHRCACQNTDGQIWRRGESNWSLYEPAELSGYLVYKLLFESTEVGHAVLTASGNIYHSFTTDGGDNWSSPILVVASRVPTDLSVFGDTIWISTNNGLYRSLNAGASWSAYSGGVSFGCVFTSDGVTVNAFSGTTLYRSTTITPSFSTVAAPGGVSGSVNSISGYGPTLYATSSSDVIKSVDYGLNWVDDTPLGASNINSSYASIKNRFLVQNDETIWTKI